MRVLVIGGSGYVGGLVLPLMADRFSLRIYDRVPPAWIDSAPTPDPSPKSGGRMTEVATDAGSPSPVLGRGGRGVRASGSEVGANPKPVGKIEYLRGDVTDHDALRSAAEEMDALLYMAMGKSGKRSVFDPAAAYDVNVKGLHLALEAAVEAGVQRAIYTSTLSVFDGHLDIHAGATDREDLLPQPRSNYGFTKWLGEEVCRYVHRVHKLPIIALRLFNPVSQQEWHNRYSPDRLNACTSAPDLARALTAALELEHSGFEIIHITGDTTGRAYNHEKAKRLLGWGPLEHSEPLARREGVP